MLVERLARLHDERHAVPPLVLDVRHERAECRAPRVLGNSVVLLVRRLASVKRLAVLPDDDILGLDRGDRPQHPHLLVADVLRRERDGPLHGEQRQHLEQVVLHDVADDAELVKVPATPLGAERLLERDLDVIDVVAVPGRAQERVAESQDENVLDHLLAEIVIDTEELIFLPVGFKRLLELPGARQVLSERFLDLPVCQLHVRNRGE